jgi:hypothetical protein
VTALDHVTSAGGAPIDLTLVNQLRASHNAELVREFLAAALAHQWWLAESIARLAIEWKRHHVRTGIELSRRLGVLLRNYRLPARRRPDWTALGVAPGSQPDWMVLRDGLVSSEEKVLVLIVHQAQAQRWQGCVFGALLMQAAQVGDLAALRSVRPLFVAALADMRQPQAAGKGGAS